jgi:hypothetical protein
MPSHSEVPIIVFVEDLNDPKSVVIVPDETYIISQQQTAHWISWQGEIVDIEFEDKPGKPDKPVCHNGHGQLKRKPSAHGTYKYTVSIRVNGKIYTADPRLVVGN